MAILETIITVLIGKQTIGTVADVTAIVHRSLEILKTLMTFAAVGFILGSFMYYYIYPIPVTELIAEKIFGSPTCTANLFGVNYCLFPSNSEIVGIITPFSNIISLLKSASFNIDLVLNIIDAVLAVVSAIWVLIRAMIGLNFLYMIGKFIWGFVMFSSNYNAQYNY